MIKRVIEQIFQDHAAVSLRKTLAEVERAASGKLHNESLADYVTRLASFKYDAEQRMAALIRLQLTTRQMASMQGISPDSVHKTRQRLRQRIGVTNETNLEEFFVSL